MNRERLGALLEAVRLMDDLGEDGQDGFEEEDDAGIAVLHIRGPLAARPSFWSRVMGWPDHETIGRVARKLASDDSIRGVVLAIDSPGGVATGSLEAADEIAALAAVKPVYAVADHYALSGGYLCAVAASRFYVSRIGEVGSIGVVWPHVDQSQRDRDSGLAVTFVTYGEKKVDRSPHVPLSDGARKDLQAKVDVIGDAFVSAVASGRGLTEDDVRATEAGIYMGQEAIEAGLADEVGTVEQAVADMRAELADQDTDSTFAPGLAARRRGLARTA